MNLYNHDYPTPFILNISTTVFCLCKMIERILLKKMHRSYKNSQNISRRIFISDYLTNVIFLKEHIKHAYITKPYLVLFPCYLPYKRQGATHVQTEASHHTLEASESWVSCQQTTDYYSPAIIISTTNEIKIPRTTEIANKYLSLDQ